MNEMNKNKSLKKPLLQWMENGNPEIVIFFGPGDFSHGIGAPGEWEHLKITETRKRIAEVCLAHGKFAGTIGNPSNLKELIKMGYRFINIGADVVGLSQYCKDLSAEFKKYLS